MAQVRLFAGAREAAGTDRAEFYGSTVAEVLGAVIDQFGPDLEALLPSCRIWVNGEPADADDPVGEADEVAILPPVSGGCG